MDDCHGRNLLPMQILVNRFVLFLVVMLAIGIKRYRQTLD